MAVDNPQPDGDQSTLSQALYRKWRPHLWGQVVGQEHIVHTLQNAIRAGRVGHAYLFAGPRGTGKTTTARLLAKAVNCTDPDLARRPCDQCAHCAAVNQGRFLDLIEIDAASNTSVDDVRDLREKINFSPSEGQYKVYIIDEVHMLSTAAFNALLKTLEEPPPHAIFILATTEVHKIPATVLSRCQRHEFRRIPVTEIVGYLKPICAEEKIAVDAEALTLIARQATGSMRDAISLLDQLASNGEVITLAMAQTVLGTATIQLVVDLMDAILNRKADAGLGLIHAALDSGSDPRQFARQVVDYLRGLMLVRLGNADQVEATVEVRQQMTRQAQRLTLPQLTDTLRLFNTAASETRGGWQPGLLLELAFVEALEEKSAPAQAPAASPAPPAPPTVVVFQKNEPSAPPAAQAPAASPPPAAHETKRESTVKPPTPDKIPPPTVPTTPAPAESAPAAPTGALTLQQILDQWGRIRAMVKKMRGPTEALLNSCKLQAVKDGMLVMGFSSEIIKSKMEANDNIKITRSAIQQALGVDIPITCVVMGTKMSESNPAEQDIEGDGLVRTALNLGGKIVQKD